MNKDLVELVTLKDTRVVKLKVQEMNSVLWKSTDVGTFVIWPLNLLFMFEVNWGS